jgi:branched-subunit amino acid aminotransferase/4-amino-4-deoxychorismate lyase
MNLTGGKRPPPLEPEVFFDTGLMPAAGRLFLEEAHERRLTETATHFGFTPPPLPALLAESARRAQPPPPWRFRAGFHPAGRNCLEWELRVEPIPFGAVCPEHPWSVSWMEVEPGGDPDLWRHKSIRNRAWRDAWTRAGIEGLDDALLADPRDRALEFSRGNLFILENGDLITPPDEGRPLLPGLMRQALLEWDGIGARCEDIPWDRVLAADGVLLTNALRLLVPVGRVCREGRSYRLNVSPRLAELRHHWRRRALHPA